MPNSPIVPWLLTEDAAPQITERIEVDGHAIEIPILGSVSVDEARYLTHYNEKYGLSNTALIPMASAVYTLLLLRFGGAVWVNDELAPIRGTLPSFEDVMSYGTPRRMLPSALISQVFMFFMDEFSSNLGNERTALAAERDGQEKARKAMSRLTGAISTGNSSATTQDIPDSQDLPSDDAPSTSSPKRSKATKLNGSEASTMTAVA